ncbi:hypothetical protein FDECE_10589 [Fusarium decemcellulare]|nr:hypothetical protein FDECE_10589 [Fusarium decemcellulare]
MDPASRFVDINETLVGVRAELKYQDIRDCVIVAERLLAVDKMLIHWAETLPNHTAPSGLTGCRRATCVWNSYRNVRLLIHESIMAATLKYGTDEEKASLQSSAKVLVDMENGICHSTAYHLGYQRSDGKLKYLENVPAPGGYLLLWPHFFSGILRTTPKEQRQWVAKTIRRMGVQMGLQLAMSMAKLLEEKVLSFSHSDTIFLGEWHPC